MIHNNEIKVNRWFGFRIVDTGCSPRSGLRVITVDADHERCGWRLKVGNSHPIVGLR